MTVVFTIVSYVVSPILNGENEVADTYNRSETVTDVTDYYIRSGAGTTESPYTYAAPSEAAGTCDADGKAVDDVTYYRKVEIIGADIRGNVYGGGNNAVVTGSTNVTIGKKDL